MESEKSNPTPATSPDDRVEVGNYRSEREGLAHSVVLLAMGEPCWLEPGPDGERLLVEPGSHGHARAELKRFDREATPQPKVAAPRAGPLNHDWVTPLFWALVVLAGFQAQMHWPAFTAAGANEALAVWDHGQVWRAFTALWLHSDLGHLVSNLVPGLFIVRATVAAFGTVGGWLRLLGAAVAANLLVAAVHHPDPYRSIGASTLVFAGLGMLTGRAMRESQPQRRWRALLVPMAAGATLLGLYGAGAGDGTVDVLAHVTGFAAGLAAGALTKRTGATLSV